MGGLGAELDGTRSCFVVTSCRLGGTGPRAPILLLKLFLAHLDPTTPSCFLRSVVGCHTAGGRRAQPRQTLQHSGRQIVWAQINTDRKVQGTKGRERRAATDIYCVPGSMRLFCLLGKGEWTSLTSCVGDMAEEPHRQGQHETEPVSKGTRTPWASGWGELSAGGGCHYAPRAGGLGGGWERGGSRRGWGGRGIRAPRRHPPAHRPTTDGGLRAGRHGHLSPPGGAFSDSLFLSTLNTYVHPRPQGHSTRAPSTRWEFLK